jgi:hypothetical protein
MVSDGPQAERTDRVTVNSALYSEGAVSNLCHPSWGSCVYFLTFQASAGTVLELGHDRFIPCTFQFIIHYSFFDAL